jgi:hypothetical protein
VYANSDPRPHWMAAFAIASVTTAAALSGCATADGGATAANTSNAKLNAQAAAQAAPQMASQSAPQAADPQFAAVNVSDADMPADLGAPLGPVEQAKPTGKPLSIDMSIAKIAAKPQGKAVLDQDIPGLCERPEFAMFKGMSLKKLAGLSGGRITHATLNQVQADLVKVNVADDSPIQ